MKLQQLRQLEGQLRTVVTEISRLEADLQRLAKLEHGTSVLLEKREMCKHEVCAQVRLCAD